MKYFYLFLLLGMMSFQSRGQAQDIHPKGQVKGTLLDNEKKAVEFATVGLFKANDSSLVKTALTTETGTFSFEQISYGTYFMKASYMGLRPYRSALITLNASNASVTIPVITMESEGTTLNAVQIVAQKPLIERRIDKVVMNVENSSIAVGSTALEVLQQAPGVSVDQQDKISMQGKQGVLIMIDGKQTYMSHADVANLLRNMQSAQIESIELITNPSSKYDASGNSGIINIKTKKSKNVGTNGSVSGGMALGRNFRGNSGLSLNHRSEWINVYGNVNYGYNQRDNQLDIDRVANGSPDTYFTQRSTTDRTNNGVNYKAGIDVFLNKRNTLGFLVNGYNNSNQEDSRSLTSIGTSFSKTDSVLKTGGLSDNGYRNMAYNLNYKGVLDSAGQEISADLDYSNYHGRNASDYINHFLWPDGNVLRPSYEFRNRTPSEISIRAFKVDYTLPLDKKTRLEAGLKSSWVETDNNLIAEELIGQQWTNDVRRSNRFIYEENVNAVYTNINRQFGKTGVQLGLRMEQTNSTGNLVTYSQVVKRSYWDFFPTLFINHSLSDLHQFGFSYSRRIDRPGYDALNPFVYYLDQYAYNKGNPFLNPQYTNNFEVSYTLMQKYMLSLNYSLVKDVITEVLLPDNAQKALYQTYENLATNVMYGANLNIPFKVGKWWSSNQNLNVFYLGFESPNLAGEALKTGRTAYQFRSQHTFTIVPGFAAELMGNYESALEYGTLSVDERYQIDMGLSKSLWKKKATVRMSLSDVFNTQETKLKSAFPNLNYHLYQKNDTRMLRFNVSYRFGKTEIKPERRRNTGTESEQGRMKN